MTSKHIQDLEEKIADLKKRWSPHSVPAALLQELDDLEDELAEELDKVQGREVDA